MLKDGGTMKLKLVVIAIFITMLLVACGPSATPEGGATPDVAAIRTSAASTVIAQFTLTAAVFTPTSSAPTETSAPEATAAAPTETSAQITGTTGTPLALCDKYSWDVSTVDVNYPDDTAVSPGQDFIKTWKIKNTGTCTWGAGYTIVYAGYTNKMSGQPVAFSEVLPNQEVEISVQFKAPNEAGSYVSAWTLANAKGVPFFGNDNKPLYVRIIVQ